MTYPHFLSLLVDVKRFNRLRTGHHLEEKYKDKMVDNCLDMIAFLARTYPYGNRDPEGDKLKEKVHRELEKLNDENY